MTMTACTYNAWSLLLQFIIGGAMIATYVVYYKQLKVMRNANVGQNLVTIHTYTTKDDFRKQRKALYVLGESKKPFEKWTDQERENAESICAKYNFVAVMVSKNVVQFELIANELRYGMNKCHSITEPLLEEVRKKREPHLWKEFSLMARRLEVYKSE